ncbi:hypothetical protein A7985_20265 [Pseudoalteromonas luteoviolacea]|uniref:Uncharacterized protein n=1 Tax=Pseudoalteromonas luteoviolacea TaxID=43657 RepID=A0A1C0TLY0_9GAMM|nr:hypothetical protein [Pseudoalteromonas luteoviolacea]MBQ4813382.1 hypothetical protein [Pseudoalteromonas luteoviolacea]OCQ19747.1 hypothetical protein A7985_20265 [Pseudoalteromonas luteoviolacea]
MLSQRRLLALSIMMACIAIAPLVAILIAEFVSSQLDCIVNERSDTPCELLGTDITMLLASFYVSGWASFITLPLAGGLAALLYLKYLDKKLMNNESQ